MHEVREEATQAGRIIDYMLFERYYAPSGDAKPTWKELAADFQLSDWKIASRKADWVKDHLSLAIQRQVRRYVKSSAEVDDEIRDLLQ